MANVIKLRRGLDIRLKGAASQQMLAVGKAGEYALMPSDFVGVTPRVVVKEGDRVLAGDSLFVSKDCPEVGFASPVSGRVKAVVRGERRKVLCVKVEADDVQEYRNYGAREVRDLKADEVKAALLEAGLFGYIDQLPYAVSTSPKTEPKAIFVSALRDMPLSGDFEYELLGNEGYFQAGLTALSRIAHTYLGIGAMQKSDALVNAKDVKVTVFSGKCPAGNVGVHVNHLCPVNKGEVVWTVDPVAVIFFGRLFLEGKVNLTRKVAIAGSEMKTTGYVEMKVGASLDGIVSAFVDDARKVRVINGNPLTGTLVDGLPYLGAHVSEITAIPEGDDADEFAGWIMPRFSQFSVSRSYFSWLMGNRSYTLDARVKGGRRNIIMSGEYDRVLPMDIYGEYLIKAILAKDIDRMEQLGIYEVAPQDFALAEFVDSSKLELQRIVREGLDMLRKENS